MSQDHTNHQDAREQDLYKRDNSIIRWLYMRKGDMLLYQDRNNHEHLVGPIQKIEDRPDMNMHTAPTKRYALVPGLRDTTKLIDVPLERVHAVMRNDIEVIRFTENEQQSSGCGQCGMRKIDRSIKGSIFCSLHCQLTWIERYYQDYPQGENPIDLGAYINTTNCGACRKLNRAYCPKCVD